MYPILFRWGDTPILHTFGVLVLAGVLVGLWWIKREAKKLDLDPEEVASLGVEVFLAGLVGSRIMFVWMNWETHYADAGWFAPFNIREGGLVWYGGLLAAAPVAFWRFKAYGLPMLRLGDLFAPATILGLGIGRIGCLMAGDDHGKIIATPDQVDALRALPLLQGHDLWVVDEIPWYAITFTDKNALVGNPEYLHRPLMPSQPLMALGCLVVFAILALLRRPLAWAPGAVTALLFVLYPIHRYLIEVTRGDRIRGFLPEAIPVVGGLSTSQAISVLAVPFGLAAFAFFLARGARRAADLRARGLDPNLDAPEERPARPAPAPEGAAPPTAGAAPPGAGATPPGAGATPGQATPADQAAPVGSSGEPG